MLTFAVVIQWAFLICAPESHNPDARCLAWVSECILSEYQVKQDPDWAFEQCAEMAPDDWIRD